MDCLSVFVSGGKNTLNPSASSGGALRLGVAPREYPGSLPDTCREAADRLAMTWRPRGLRGDGRQTVAGCWLRVVGYRVFGPLRTFASRSTIAQSPP